MKQIEIVGKRKPKEKHFLQEDGTFKIEMYDEDIHFLKNNYYEEIDNTLVLDNKYYKNKNNKYIVKFNSEVDGNIFKIEKDEHYIEFSLNKFEDYSNKCINYTSKISSKMIYNNILKNIDLYYDITSSKLKENIILLNKNNDIDNLIFNIKSDLEFKVENDGSICALYENKEIFKFDPPYMIDSKGEKNNKISYNLIKDNDCYQLFMFLDKKWLQSDITYPVIIDPTITNSTSENNVYDTYIYPGDNGIDRNSLGYLKAGVERINNKDIINRTLLKFDLPVIGTGSQVVNAYLNITAYPDYTFSYEESIVNIHKVTEGWTENLASWDSMNDKFDNRVEGTFDCSRIFYTNENGEIIHLSNYNVDITSLVQKWYTNTPNNGIMLKTAEEKYKTNVIPVFYSKNNSDSQKHNINPLLVITYRNQNGLENYMDYESHSFNRCTIYHNTYNGNLIGIFNVGSTKSGKMPANLKLVYNTNDVVLSKNIGYGMGNKLNFNQTIKEVNIDDKIYLEYNDEDGTIHYFLNKKAITSDDTTVSDTENIFYDEDGLNLKIEKLNSKYILRDKNNNEMMFIKYNDIGYLSEIKDVSGNINTIYYDLEYKQITGIKDANDQWIDIIYNENNTISIKSPDETVTLSFLDKNVIGSIIFIDDTLFISHNENYLISEITNISGKKIKYEYYNKIPYKLKKVSEYGTDNNLGNYYNINYGFNVTTIIDSKNRAKTITYNSNGNPISISNLKSSNDINGAYGSKIIYGENFNDMELQKNKLLSTKIPLKYVKNLLSNTSFEEETIDFISSETGMVTLSDEFVNSGFKSLKFENLFNLKASASKVVSVDKGKYYTFSAYLKTSIYYTPVKLCMFYEDAEGKHVEVCSEEIIANDDFERLDVTIFYPVDALSNLTLAVCMNGRGLCFIDDIQLEEGEVPNNYNMIENSDFSNGLSGWILYTNDDYPVSQVFNIVDLDEQKALRINMFTPNTTSVQKKFKVCGKTKDSYTLSFWYKNKGLCGAENGIGDLIKNNISISFNPVDEEKYGGDSWVYDFTLNPNENEWQYFTFDFNAEYDFKEILLVFYQNKNANEFYIANINLFKDVRSITYDYDENGNIISSKNLNDKVNKFNYDKNNELIKMMDPKGNNFYYEYDNVVTDRVVRGISSSGISNEIEYDSFGNPIISRIIDRGQMMKSSNGLYKVRLKGTNQTIGLINNSLSLIDDTHGHNKWNLEKVTIGEIDYYKIYHNIISNKYLTNNNNIIILSEYQNDNSLFEIIKQDNGSFHLKNRQNSKYIKKDNNCLILTDLIDNDPNFEFYFESNTNGEFIENSAEYTEDGKFIKKITDTNFSETKFDIDIITGLMKSITNSKNQTTYYNYNNKRQLQSIINKDKIVNYEYNINNTLSKITQNDRIYNFEYDNFLNIKSIKIGDNIKLINNIYEENNGNLISTIYGNNQTINYEYDEFNRIKKIAKGDDLYNYKYNNNGDLVKVVSNNDIIKYTYDLAKRLYEYKFNDFKIRYNYDSNDNIISKNYKLDNINHTISNTLNDDDSVIKVIIDTDEINYNYDSLGRLIGSNINNNYNTNYEYIKNGKRTSMIVKSISNNYDKYSYRYDKLGNITHIYHDNELENKYYYDDYNELIKEDNYILNKTIEYIYDNLGNILYKKEYEINTDNQLSQNKYEYNNSNFKDQLTKFNNEVITYDNLGNPIKIGENITLTWMNGRQLKKYVDENNTIEYKYNKDGIRISKKINNIETKYFLEGTHIILEVKDDNVLYYIRGNKELIGFKYNDTVYYYVKNNQDDIIGILNSNYNLVAKYEYDSWGNIISITDENNIDVSNNNEHIANINPYRYRSYYYDKETKLYYLNSRYYNPLWGRFINVDGIISSGNTIEGNLYNYCANDPVNKADQNGQKSIFLLPKLLKGFGKLIKKTLGKVVSSIASVGINKIETKKNNQSGSPVVAYGESGTTIKTNINKIGSNSAVVKADINLEFSNLLDSTIDVSIGNYGITLGASERTMNYSLDFKKWSGTISVGSDLQGIFAEFDSEISIKDKVSVGAYGKAGISNFIILSFALLYASKLDPSILANLENLWNNFSTSFPLIPNGPIYVPTM